MIRVLIFLLLSNLLSGDIIADYKDKKYSQICSYKNIIKYPKNLKILSVIGQSCVKSDKIYVLPLVYRRLKGTPAARINAIYFNTIYMQKQLLYSFLFDSMDIKGFELPLTDYVLSTVFYAVKEGDYEKKDDVYTVKKGEYTYRLYKDGDRMVIDTYKNDKLLKRRWYR